MKSDFVGIRTDLISSAKQISSELRSDFIASYAISLKSIEVCVIMYLTFISLLYIIKERLKCNVIFSAYLLKKEKQR